LQFQAYPSKIVGEIHIIGKKVGMLSDAWHPNYSRKYKTGSSPGQLGKKKQDPVFKTTRAKTAGGMAQVVEHLPSMCKALSSNPRTAKKIHRCEGALRADRWIL
jgi:hypothetical protein